MLFADPAPAVANYGVDAPSPAPIRKAVHGRHPVALAAAVDDLFDDLFDRAWIGMSLPLLIRGTHGAGKSEQLRRMQLRAADNAGRRGRRSGPPTRGPVCRTAEPHPVGGDRRPATGRRLGVPSALGRRFRRCPRRPWWRADRARAILHTSRRAGANACSQFDDLHHADAASCQAMLHLVRHLFAGHLSSWCSRVPTNPCSSHGWRRPSSATSGRRSRDHRARTTRPRRRAGRVVARRLDAEPDPALLDHIVELSKGNAHVRRRERGDARCDGHDRARRRWRAGWPPRLR